MTESVDPLAAAVASFRRNVAEMSPEEQKIRDVPTAKVDTSSQNLIAQANQDYYLHEAAKKNKCWICNPKTAVQYSENVLCTPAMAKDALDRNLNPRKRINWKEVDKYARDMSAGRWLPTHQGIGIDTNGNIYDGQHRLHAILKSGISVILYFTWNVVPEARFVVDNGKKRSVAEKLEVIGINKIGAKMPAVCRAMMRGISGTQTFSDGEVAAFANKWHAIIEEVVNYLPNYRADALAPICKAVILYGKDKMSDFIETLACCGWKTENHPCKKLYFFVNNCPPKTSHFEYYKKTLTAIDHYINNINTTEFETKETDLFVWDLGWMKK